MVQVNFGRHIFLKSELYENFIRLFEQGEIEMPTDVMEQLRLKARANPQRVVFPEADEEKILRAVRQVRDMGIAYPILVGERKAISVLAGNVGVSLDGITVIDHTDAGKVEQFASGYAKINPDFPASAVKRMLRDPLYFAAMMVKLDEADCMVAGLSHTTGEVIMASEMIIGLQDGISTVSSTGILSIPGYEGPEGNLSGDCRLRCLSGARFERAGRHRHLDGRYLEQTAGLGAARCLVVLLNKGQRHSRACGYGVEGP